MGLEDYQVLVVATACSRFVRATVNDIVSVSQDIQQSWTGFKVDVKAYTASYVLDADRVAYLLYESAAGLFQAEVSLSRSGGGDRLIFSVRFAYCNPRTVYAPYIAFIAWLMKRYGMSCISMRDLGPPGPLGFPESTPIEKTDDLEAILIPSIEYNRRLWQLDAQSTEEAAIRPGEALERFILPLCKKKS